MPAYFLADYLAAEMALSHEELTGFERQGVISPVVRNGRTYYSSGDFYRLRGVLYLVRNVGLSLERALARVESLTCPSSPMGARREWHMMSSRIEMLYRIDYLEISPFLVCNLLARRSKQLRNEQHAMLSPRVINLALKEFLGGKLQIEVKGGGMHTALDSKAAWTAKREEYSGAKMIQGQRGRELAVVPSG